MVIELSGKVISKEEWSYLYIYIVFENNFFIVVGLVFLVVGFVCLGYDLFIL